MSCCRCGECCQLPIAPKDCPRLYFVFTRWGDDPTARNVAYCNDYENRPEICRQYRCAKLEEPR